MKKFLTSVILSVCALCMSAQEKVIILNEGSWQSDNGRLSYFEDGTVLSNQWFRDVNGNKLGDTPNDIIQVNESLIAIAINWSNIVQFISPDGRAIAAIEDIPNNRKLCTDGNFVYVSSYGHECTVSGAPVTFTKGFVAKIDINTFQVIDAVEVGYEPDGIAMYNDHIFVANTGGYAFSEGHDYESTVSIINAKKMEVVKTIDTGQINLYGKMSQSGQYLCINSPGDYYEVDAATIIFDCQAALEDRGEIFVKLPYAATYSTTDIDGNFYAIGSRFSYQTYEYVYDYLKINPQAAINSLGNEGISIDNFPGTILSDLRGMTSAYGIYINPYTGYIYATDAKDYASSGELYQWSPKGELLGKHDLYICPGHFLALKPDGYQSVTVTEIEKDKTEAIPVEYYNLQGIRIEQPRQGLNIVRMSDGSGRKIFIK